MGLVTIPTVVASANAGMNELKITASGTWTAPSGVNIVWLHMIGGGGGGGRNTNNNMACNGTSGEIIYQQVSVVPGTVYTATIGAGGASNSGGVATTIFSLTANGGQSGGIGGFNAGYSSFQGGTSIGLQGRPVAPGSTGAAVANSGMSANGINSATASNSGGSGVIILKWLN